MPNKMRLEQITKHKKMFYIKKKEIKKQKNGREECKEFNIEAVSKC